MGIYRGAGGTGDAVNDASSEASIVVVAKDAALAAQAAAEAAQAGAVVAEASAVGSATNAATSATNAAASATTAVNAIATTQGAAAQAIDAQIAAEAAEIAAELAETNAETAQVAAELAETNAETAAATATTQAGIATTQASNASTSATSAASSATSASNSETSASTSASTATTQAGIATTKAGEAATSATTASTASTTATTQAGIATTKAGEAATSASNAATSETNAGNSASAASTSASNAATSATNAGNSASAAATSATNAEAAYDAFDDRYLGAKATAPTLDNDGNALLTGALYYNTTGTPQLYIWNGTAWDQAALNASGAVVSFNTRTGAVTLSSGDVTTALGFTPYDATNPSGYTTNTGTVTSVGGTAGTGISITGSPITGSGSLTITNTAPDQTVALTAGTGISTSGTYPNFTITNSAPDQTVALTAGTGISTSGTYPNFTVTNSAPMTYAGAGIAVSTGTAWDTSIDPTTVAYRNATNTFTANQVVSVTDNSNAALRITQTGTGNALVVEDTTNPDATPVVINSSGQIIAGHTSAITIGSANQGLQVIGTGTNGNITVGRYTNDVTGSFYGIGKSRSTTVGSFSTVNSSDTFGNFIFYGDDGTSFVEGARIAAQVDGTPGTNDMPGRLVFSTTADGAASPTERMRIDNAGRVGIGVTPPAGWNVVLGRNITGAASSFGFVQSSNVLSDVTNAFMYSTNAGTQATTFTLTGLHHYRASQGAIGAGSIVTNQYGYFVDANLTGATNNFGFYGNIASGTGRWNFYANGTAANYFGGTTTFARAVQEARVVVAASDINLSLGNYFTRTISGATTLTVSNIPATGTAQSFILDLTNGGAAAITWFSGVKWAGGTAPTLTAAGRDVLGFFTHDGGTNWTGLVLGKDVK